MDKEQLERRERCLEFTTRMMTMPCRCLKVTIKDVDKTFTVDCIGCQARNAIQGKKD